MKREQTNRASNLPSSVSGVFVGVFSTEFICFHFFSLTFPLSDHPSPLLRQMSGSRVPERAIRIRIINIISFHCDPRCGPLHTQGHQATNITATESRQLSIYPPPPPREHTLQLMHPPWWLNCSLRDDKGEAAVAAVAGWWWGGPAGPEGRHTMERAADQRSGEIELEIFHGWLA